MSTSRDEIIRILLQTGGIGEAKKLRDELNDIVGASERAAKSQLTFGQAINQSKVALAGAGLALAGVVRVFGQAAAASSQYQSALAEIGTLLSNQTGIPEITAQLNEQARTFGGSVVSQAKAYYQIISAGAKEGAEANAILSASNQLAVGGLTSLQTAADGLTSVLNAYNLGADQATRVSDLFFTAVRDGKTTVDELSSTLGRVAPLASEAGVGLDELLAAVAALTKTGASTEQAVTAIRGALTGVIKPTSEAAELAERLGLSFDAAALKSKGFAGFLGDVAAATGGNQAQLAKLFGSVEGLNGVLALTGSQADSFAISLRNMGDSAGAAQRAFELIDDTPAQRLARFQAATEQLRLSLGNLVSAFAPVLEGAASVLNLFTALPAPVQAVAVGLAAVAAAAIPLRIAITALAPAFAALSASIGATFAGSVVTATGALGRLGAALALLGKAAVPALLATPYIALTAAVLDARDATASLQRTQESVREQIERELEARRRVAGETQIFSQQAILTAQELNALGKAELIEYNRKLALAKQFNTAQIGILVREEEINGRTEETGRQLAAASKRAGELRVALDSVGAALKASTEDLSPRFISVQEAFKALGISAETAGLKITDTGRVALQAFDSIAMTAETSARQILESYSAALAKLSTSAEVKALGASLLEAFTAGRIGLNEFVTKSQEAIEKLKELRGDLDATADDSKKLPEAIDRIPPALDRAAASAKSLRDAAREVGDELDATSEKQAGAANALSGELNGIRESLRAFGDEAVLEFDRVFQSLAGPDNVLETTGLRYAAVLEKVANVANGVAAQFQATQAAAERKATALAFLAQNGEAAGRALAELGYDAEDVRNGLVDTSVALRALNGQRMDRVRSELQGVEGVLAGIQEESRNAVAALAELNREYEKAALQRSGNEQAIAEAEFQEELRRIEELERAAGVAGANEAAEARRLAREEHEARLREIREHDEAERASRRERERESGSGSGAGGAGSGGGSSGGSGGGSGAASAGGRTVTVNLNVTGGGGGGGGVLSDADIQRIAALVIQAIRDSGGTST